MSDDDIDDLMHDAGFAEWQTQVMTNIAKYGQQLVGVFPEEDDPAPSFTYSIGLNPKFGFELFVIGLPFTSAGYLLNHVAAELHAGKTLEIGVKDDRWANLPVIFAETDERIRGYVCQADRYYEREVRVLQLVLPDKDGNFIGEEGYDMEYMNPRQPVLCTTIQHPSQSL